MARTKDTPRPRATQVRRAQPPAISRAPPPLQPFETPARDCFSFLPHEIIQTILDMVKDKNLALPLANRHLLPFHRARLYRRIKIKSTHQLALFTRTLASNPALAKYVVIFEAQTSDALSVAGGNRTTDSLNSTHLQVAFERLLTCRTISINGSSKVVAAFFEAARRCTSSATTSLNLGGDFSEIEDPFDVGHYRCFSALSAMFIDVKRSRQRAKPQEASQEHHPAVFFPSSKILRLADSSHLLPLPSFFAFLPKPELTKVVLLSGSDPYCSFAKALHSFTSLYSLVFESYSPSLEDTFYSALHKLPIKRLVFKSDCALDADSLTNLLHGQLQHPTLLQLDLDGESAVEGSEIDFEENNDWTTDWEVPGMNDDGSLDETYDEMKRLVKKAEEGGIKIGGNVKETLEVQEKWIRQFERARDQFEGYGTSEDEDSEGSDSD